MKGIVFNLLQECVEQAHGADTWDDLLDAAHVDGAFTSLGNYPDETLWGLVMAAASKLSIPPNDVVRWFGRNALPLLAAKYPRFFEGHTTTRDFIVTLNSIIHPEVRKLYPGADAPDFDFSKSTPEVLVMGYRSKRRLCAFAEGLIEGSATHFGEIATVEQLECVSRGNPMCLFHIRFKRAG